MKERTGYLLSGILLGIIILALAGLGFLLPSLFPSIYGSADKFNRMYVAGGGAVLVSAFIIARTIFYVIKDWHDFDS